MAGSLQRIEVPWAIPWACWAIMLFSSMKCSGRNVFMNKSMTFQHLHLEGNAAWVVIIWLWKAHSLLKSYVLYMFRKGPLGMIQGLLEQRGVSRFSGLWIRPYVDGRNWKWITILWRVWECCTVVIFLGCQNRIATIEERLKVCGIKPLRMVVNLLWIGDCSIS